MAENLSTPDMECAGATAHLFLFATSQFPRPQNSGGHCNVSSVIFQPHHNVGTWTGGFAIKPV